MSEDDEIKAEVIEDIANVAVVDNDNEIDADSAEIESLGEKVEIESEIIARGEEENFRWSIEGHLIMEGEIPARWDTKKPDNWYHSDNSNWKKL